MLNIEKPGSCVLLDMANSCCSLRARAVIQSHTVFEGHVHMLGMVCELGMIDAHAGPMRFGIYSMSSSKDLLLTGFATFSGKSFQQTVCLSKVGVRPHMQRRNLMDGQHLQASAECELGQQYTSEHFRCHIQPGDWEPKWWGGGAGDGGGGFQ